jgi:two-component system KDP operon response regulator KdpE
MKILIVEDDPEILDVISTAFEIRWPEAVILRVTTGKEAVTFAESQQPDLVVLDLGLPDIDGFEVLRQIRLFTNMPIIILTARDEEKDIVKGLERGADDYMIKPFRQLELLARAQALLRRVYQINQTNPDSYRELRFGHSIHNLFVGNREVKLTTTEGAIMSYLIRNAEKIVPFADLAEVVWGTDYVGSRDAVRVYIRRLRMKIETQPETPRYIHTHPGIGYSLRQSP